jgi:hypothetical protein
MFLLYHLITFFVVLFYFVDAKEIASDLLSCFSGDKKGIIENCVDVISGSFCESEVDHAILGIDSLVLKQ